MSPRRNTPHRRRGSKPSRQGDSTFIDRILGGERRESGPDGDWVLRPISGAAAVKAYRCPGCYQQIPAGAPHVVAWAADGDGEDRRHWHSSCWDRRLHRSIRYPRH